MKKISNFLNAEGEGIASAPEIQQAIQNTKVFMDQFQKSVTPFGQVTATTIQMVNDLMQQLSTVQDPNQQMQIIAKLRNSLISVQQNYAKPLADLSAYVNKSIPQILAVLNKYAAK